GSGRARRPRRLHPPEPRPRRGDRRRAVPRPGHAGRGRPGRPRTSRRRVRRGRARPRRDGSGRPERRVLVPAVSVVGSDPPLTTGIESTAPLVGAGVTEHAIVVWSDYI